MLLKTCTSTNKGTAALGGNPSECSPNQMRVSITCRAGKRAVSLSLIRSSGEGGSAVRRGNWRGKKPDKHCWVACGGGKPRVLEHMVVPLRVSLGSWPRLGSPSLLQLPQPSTCLSLAPQEVKLLLVALPSGRGARQGARDMAMSLGKAMQGCPAAAAGLARESCGVTQRLRWL